MKNTVFLWFVLLFTNTLTAQMMNTEPENLGKSINTEYEERSPVIAPDGKTLYFIRQGSPENVGLRYSKTNQDIWYSTLKADGSWTKAKNIGVPLNTSLSNGVMSVTPDGNTLLLFGNYDTSSTNGGVSISYRKAGGWSVPEKQIINDYHNTSNWYQFYLSNDGKVLLSAIQNEETFGMNDIFASFLKEDGTWTKPKNLGKNVNSKLNEISPFLASDGVSLYFSSNGLGGVGDYDVFLSRRLDDTWENWSPAQNLGTTINTDGFDAYYKIDAAGEFAYFTSNKKSFGLGDIYRIKLPKAGQPLPVSLVSGRVLNSETKEPVQALVAYELLPEGKEIGIARSSPETGEYKIILPVGKMYGFRAFADGFISINDNLDLRDIFEYKEIQRNLELVPIETGKSVRLNNVFFDTNQSLLKPESFPELNRIVKLMTEKAGLSIEICGYTDNNGTVEFNKNLSLQRAKAVYDYLIQKNIPKSRLSFKGYGESNPIADNDSEEGRKLNRRVELLIKN
ncbi:MAG: OmpA family protein [Bacteroidota bacterium]